MLYTIAETTYTPQGDGNVILIYCKLTQKETTYTPQGDGNSHSSSPRTPQMETTYTPQGDGNWTAATSMRYSPLKQLTPRKRTKTRQR